MSLVHHPDQIGGDIVALECHQCQTRYGINDFVVLGDPLQCVRADCLAGGMIAHKASRMSERFPEPLGRRFTPLPDALMDQAAALSLGAHELLLIWALERHRRVMGEEVYPGRKLLARLTRLSEHQVKRASSKLVASGLVGRRQPGSINKERGRAPNLYDLDPLWERIASLECGGAPQIPEPPDLGAHDRPQSVSGEYLRATENPFVGDIEPIWGAPVRPEVDVVEVDALKKEILEGTSPAAPDLAADGISTDQDEQDNAEHHAQWLEAQRHLSNARNLHRHIGRAA